MQCLEAAEQGSAPAATCWARGEALELATCLQCLRQAHSAKQGSACQLTGYSAADEQAQLQQRAYCHFRQHHRPHKALGPPHSTACQCSSNM